VTILLSSKVFADLSLCVSRLIVHLINVHFAAMNRTIPDESGRVHGWIAEPSGRGTAGLLYNCLVTIFLCVWSALHINILERNASWMQNLLYKAGLALLAIIAPEYIFYNAIDSYFLMRDSLNGLPASFFEVRVCRLFSFVISRYEFVLTEHLA
jgi:hypothetical protein